MSEHEHDSMEGMGAVFWLLASCLVVFITICFLLIRT